MKSLSAGVRQLGLAPSFMLKAFLVMIVMAAILTAGVVLTVGGNPWLLIVGFLAFAFLFIKYGCLAH